MKWVDNGEVITPNIIREFFGPMINAGSAVMIHRLVTGDYNSEHYQYVKNMIADSTPSDKIMCAINQEISYYGVECIRENDKVIFEYINTGGTYSPTVIYDQGHYHLSSWGTYFENWENEKVAEYQELWGDLPLSERIESCLDAGISIFAARCETIPNEVLQS